MKLKLRMNGDTKMTSSKQKKTTRENVFEFYATHTASCDQSYALTEDKNIHKLYSEVDDKCDQNTLFTKTSIVILTANKYERNILHKKIYEQSRNKIKKMEIELFTACERFKKAYAYWFEVSGYCILNIHANVTGSYTIGGSADIVRWVLSNKYLFPTAIISFGICFGTRPDTNELGDVVISRKVYPYFIGAKINGEGVSVVDDNAFHISDSLDNRILELENNNILKFDHFTVCFKNYITGEAVISSETFRDKFVNITTQVIYAGDMEGYGLFKECTSYPHSVPCLIIKSICDWADEKNFDVNDKKILSEFRAKFCEHNPEININERKILRTLKDRLQAYSASCAFDVLNVIIQNEVAEKAMLDNIRAWIKSFHGSATSCEKIREKILNRVAKFNLGFAVSESFIHRCLIILENEEILKCDMTCRQGQNEEDKCLVPELKASIDII